MDFHDTCYFDRTKKITKFVPETAFQEIEVTKELYEKYFPKFEELEFTKLKMSKIGLYSMIRPRISEKICNIIKKLIRTGDIIVTDALGNMGGMTLALAKNFAEVNVCEIVPENCSILKNNIDVYQFSNVKIYCGDYFDYMLELKQNILFFDPPWSGPEYKKIKYLSLYINGVNVTCIIQKLLDRAEFILMIVPFNYNFSNLTIFDKYTVIKIRREPRALFLVTIRGKWNPDKKLVQ